MQSKTRFDLVVGDAVEPVSDSAGGFNRLFFFFNDTATTEIYPLSLHDALPISRTAPRCARWPPSWAATCIPSTTADRKSTRLNSSHGYISYAVFCLKKKNSESNPDRPRSL